MKKKSVAIIVFLLAFCVVLSACRNGADLGVTDSDGEPEKVLPSVDDTDSDGAVKRDLLGVWWWSDSLGDEYLDFAEKNGVTEIYFCSSKFNEGTETFIEKAQADGISVYWLAGEYEWVENPDNLIKKVEKYLNYQATHTYKFAGIHFDIEPHQHPEFKSRRAELLEKFVKLTYSLKKSYPDVWIEYDLPFWLNDEITVDGEVKPAYRHIMDNASRVTVMSYRDTAEKIYSVASNMIDYAKATQKPFNLGVNTKSTEGDQVSFQEEGKQYMYDEIARLREMLPENFGVVIHHIKPWYDLKE